MQFVLTLHSHLPYVLNHGRWPHGSDWLCEAALDTYLPLLEVLLDLEKRAVPAPLTLGMTPVLGNQLASPAFRQEMDAFFRQRLLACEEAPGSLRETGDEELLPLVGFWKDRFQRLQGLWEEVGRDLVGAFRRLQDAGRLEIISSAATHGFLPLLGRDESVRLQLAVGFAEHRRLFGRAPQGCWTPECAYRPGGLWDPIPGVSRARDRKGLETLLHDAGYRFFFIDTHMAGAGESLGSYGDVPHGVERFDAAWEGESRNDGTKPTRSAHQAYLVDDQDTGAGVTAFVREPQASVQVWSRHHGYPGDESYLDFHKIRWPGGLKFWRVTGPDSDLGDKGPYHPVGARCRASDHATHFAGFLGHIQRQQKAGPSGVAMAPFDTELFGHWWFEGVSFLGELFQRLPYREEIVPVTASQHLDSFPAEHTIRPLEGSWGAGGDFSMWLNEETRWTWDRLWRLEEAFWNLAPTVPGSGEARDFLAHAGRQLLLAQSSDWQFMISTGAVPDYGEKRFNLHCDDLEALLEALRPGTSAESLATARNTIPDLEKRDDLFPDILRTLDQVLGRT
jgi:1,4-alpha-glucan branching enzyme